MSNLKIVSAFEDESGRVWKTEAEYAAHKQRVEKEEEEKARQKLIFVVASMVPGASGSQYFPSFLQSASMKELETVKEIFTSIQAKRMQNARDGLSMMNLDLKIGK